MLVFTFTSSNIIEGKFEQSEHQSSSTTEEEEAGQSKGAEFEQFNKLPNGKKEGCKTYLDPKNRTKNRYGNIYYLERTRVHLQFLKEDGAYIHANRIRYPTLKNQFIITQGPLASTLVDFWRMIWQEKAENIVMLCNLSENGKPKSTEYFGQTLGSSSTFRQIAVKTCMRDYDQGLVGKLAQESCALASKIYSKLYKNL